MRSAAPPSSFAPTAARPRSGLAGLAGTFRRLRRDFAEPLRVEELARAAHLSPSAFHRHFKAVAAMTPIQYQKHLRLQAARRLMLTGAADAATAAYRVGYASASQFSREYRRLFGQTPRRDVARLVGEAAIRQMTNDQTRMTK